MCSRKIKYTELAEDIEQMWQLRWVHFPPVIVFITDIIVVILTKEPENLKPG
jgi:hypothetical protein